MARNERPRSRTVASGMVDTQGLAVARGAQVNGSFNRGDRAQSWRREAGSGSGRTNQVTGKRRWEGRGGFASQPADAGRRAEAYRRRREIAGRLKGAAAVTVARRTERAQRAIAALQDRAILAGLAGISLGLVPAQGTLAARMAWAIVMMVVMVRVRAVGAARAGIIEKDRMRKYRKTGRGGEHGCHDAQEACQESQGWPQGRYVPARIEYPSSRMIPGGAGGRQWPILKDPHLHDGTAFRIRTFRKCEWIV